MGMAALALALVTGRFTAPLAARAEGQEPPTFTVALEPRAARVSLGSEQGLTVLVTFPAGAAAAVRLTVGPLPEGFTARLERTSVAPVPGGSARVRLIVRVPDQFERRQVVVRVRGEGDGVSRESTATLTLFRGCW